MDLFGIGPLEVLVILVVALIIFGPEKLPQVGRALGRGVRSLRKATSDLTAEVTKEIEADSREKENKPEKRIPSGDKTDDSTQL